MITERNEIAVMEVCNYRKDDVPGGVLVRYEMRQPGKTHWKPVTIFRPIDDTATVEPQLRVGNRIRYHIRHSDIAFDGTILDRTERHARVALEDVNEDGTPDVCTLPVDRLERLDA